LSKDIQHTAGHAGKEIEGKAKGVAHGAEHKGVEFKHSIEAAGSKISNFGHKKLDGKTIEVHNGDTLWGIARKYNVCRLETFFSQTKKPFPS
jgi:LysM repeat protein